MQEISLLQVKDVDQQFKRKLAADVNSQCIKLKKKWRYL